MPESRRTQNALLCRQNPATISLKCIIFANMKKFITIFAAAAVMFSAGSNAAAQSIGDILKSAANSSTIKSAVESATGISLNASIIGTWTYTGSAVSLKSDNKLTEIAGNAAVASVSDKLDGYLEKIGIREGTFSYTFASDSTFTTTFKGKTLKGTYSISQDGKRLTMKYGSQMQLLSMTGEMSATSSSCRILFEADELMTFLKRISKVAGNRSNSGMAALSGVLDKYDGVNLGFELKK